MDTGSYWRDGFLFPIQVMSATQAQALGEELLRLLDQWSGHPSLRRPLIDYCRANFNVVTKWGARIARQPAILDSIEQLIGPSFVCWMTEVIIKQSHSEKFLSIHQDFTYWDMDDSDKGLTAWLALTPAIPENGCMEFGRGSHRRGQVRHHDTFAANNLLSRGQEIAVSYDPDDVVHCCLQPGELSLHHSLTFHGSGPNRTDSPRVAAVMRYLSTDMAHLDGTRSYAMLVRGRDAGRNFQLFDEPDADFSRQSMALYEQISLQQEAHFAAGATRAPRYRP